ncbi:MAG: YncE family protein [Vulcanimicrobiaceae bacterium]
MLIAPLSPPAHVVVYSDFDYVTIDAKRRRVYAAHTGSRTLLIVDADSGKPLGQVEVGPMHGVAVDPATGTVFTGDGTERTVSKVNPTTQMVLAQTGVPGPVDAIAYDPAAQRIYADEDSGTEVYAIDARSMKLLARIRLLGHDEEFLAVDPRSHVVYQNVADLDEFVEIDPKTLRVFKIVHTPALKANHPLQVDAALNELLVGGENGVLAAYRPDGTLLGTTRYPADVDQCNLDAAHGLLACAGNGVIALLRVVPNAAPTTLATLDTHHAIHTLAIDPKTQNIFAVWAGPNGDFVQRFHLAP